MKLRNVLIVVKDMEKAKKFYHDLFGLDVILDNDGTVILTEGLVLQQYDIWKQFLQKDIIPENNSSELYFEDEDVEAFAEKLERLYPSTHYVNRLMTYNRGQKVVRFYDLDGNLIEVREPVRLEGKI
ncbi:VOC family protein [Thermoguttaceae bacterium LCP21S3_D4]|nr:VOC family protein [Lachnospiraceae bacterium]HCJ77276.1 glyoxalase [Roseburia sp.]